MFQQAIEYNVQMTNILLKFFNLEIKNQHIIKEKDIFVQNLQGVLEKGQKLKIELQDRTNENSQVLTKLQAARQKINNMENKSKNLESVIIERDSLQATLKETNANYQGIKVEKDILSIEHSKLQKVYMHMEEILLKQQKEVEELRMDNVNEYQANNEIQKQANYRHAQMDGNL